MSQNRLGQIIFLLKMLIRTLRPRRKKKRCPNPFDPALYEYKPTKDELKDLERVMLEES